MPVSCLPRCWQQAETLRSTSEAIIAWGFFWYKLRSLLNQITGSVWRLQRSWGDMFVSAARHQWKTALSRDLLSEILARGNRLQTVETQKQQKNKQREPEWTCSVGLATAWNISLMNREDFKCLVCVCGNDWIRKDKYKLPESFLEFIFLFFSVYIRGKGLLSWNRLRLKNKHRSGDLSSLRWKPMWHLQLIQEC